MLLALALQAGHVASGAGATSAVRKAAPATKPAPPAPGKRARRTLSLKALLVLLVLATALPMGALLAWQVAQATTAARRLADREVEQVANDSGASLQGFLRQRQQQLAAAVGSRLRVRSLLDDCARLRRDASTLPGVLAEVAVVDGSGQVLCGSQRRTRLPPAARGDSLQRMAEGNGFVSAAVPAFSGGNGVYLLTQPIADDAGHVVGAVRVALPVAELLPMLHHPWPDGGVSLLVDGGAAVLARSPPGAEDRVAPDAITLPGLRAAGARARTVAAADGTRFVAALRPVGATGWSTVASVPEARIHDEARRAAWHGALAALGVLAGCATLVALLAHRITAPLAALQRCAQRVAEGRFDRRAPSDGPAELAAVADGFNRMLERLPTLQRELVQSEERHRLLLEKLSRNVPGTVHGFCMRADGTTAMPYASDHLREMFELEPADLVADASPMRERIHPDDRERLAADLRASRDSLAGLHTEFRVLLPRGGLRHYLTQSQPERLPDGSVLWYGCTLDVSPLKSVQRALQEANENLERGIRQRTAALARANEALEAFAYSVAHDLRAPLRAIGGFSEACEESLARGDSGRALRYTQRVRANTGRMDVLIDGFLALARAGQAPQDEHCVDMDRLLAEVLAEQLPDPGPQVEAQPLPRVHGDAAMLRQVWCNLVSNAVKYSSRKALPRITIGWWMREDDAVFEVRDNGAGFDPDYADKLFQPFRRLHADDEFEGTGVGLALVKRIVEAHGGRIWGEGAPDAGAVFRFTLPRARLAAREPSPQPATPACS